MIVIYKKFIYNYFKQKKNRASLIQLKIKNSLIKQ